MLIRKNTRYRYQVFLVGFVGHLREGEESKPSSLYPNTGVLGHLEPASSQYLDEIQLERGVIVVIYYIN